MPHNKQPLMRLDKLVSQAFEVSRAIARKLITSKRIQVDLTYIKDPAFKVSPEQNILLDGKPLSLIGLRYMLLNKPSGYICSNVDETLPSALNLLDLPHKTKLHFAGRLDQDTTGLVLISDDGDWTHKVTSPRKKCPKCYRVGLAEPIDQAAIEQLEAGVLLKGENSETDIAKVEMLSDKEILLTITQGKYHQVKRMLAAVGNRVVTLHRESVGSVFMSELEQGKWRELTQKEIDSFN